jgi:hypothetical protein
MGLTKTRALALLLLIAGACATRGVEFSEDSVAKIRPGVTTHRELKRWFGRPTGVQSSGSGTTAWTWTHEETTTRDTAVLGRIGSTIGSIFGTWIPQSPVNVAYENTVRHRLVVWLDDEGTVIDYTYKREEEPSKRVY